MDSARHWDSAYATKPAESMSWYEEQPAVSLRLLTAASEHAGPVIDVGAGQSRLADALLAAGWSDVTVLDVSAQALAAVTQRLGQHQAALTAVVADLLTWQPTRTYQAWHDRAVFHFLVDPGDRARYLGTATRALAPGGLLVVGAFAPAGPTHCSGLPTARYDTAGIAQQFAPAFTLEHSETERHVTPAGHIQPFTWVALRRRQ